MEGRDKMMERTHKKENVTFAIFLAAMVAILLFCGCSQPKVITEVQKEYVFDTIVQTDVRDQFIYVRDSIDRWHYEYIVVNEAGDTIKHKEKEVVNQYAKEKENNAETANSSNVRVEYRDRENVVEVEKEVRVRGFFWWLGVIGSLAAVCVFALMYFNKYDIRK